MPSFNTSIFKPSLSQKALMMKIARDSIHHGLKFGQPLSVQQDKMPELFKKPRATFVTLNLDNRLRGCIGSLEAILPLAEDISLNAFRAAFQDPRFPPLIENEEKILEIEISLLTEPEPFKFKSEKELISKITPLEDGLILSDGLKRATFLPSVWLIYPDPLIFLQQLKRKAGLPVDYWADTIKVQRYRCDVISD